MPLISVNPVYEREQALRHRLNKFFVDCLSMPEHDYCGQLDAASLLKLKSALSDINNILTLQATLAFADWVADKLSLDDRKACKEKLVFLDSTDKINRVDVVHGVYLAPGKLGDLAGGGGGR